MTINTVSIVLFIIAGLSFLVAIYSFIRFNIPQIIGELSGRTAKKSIAQMRDKNVKTGTKSHHPSPVAKERGTITNKINRNNKVANSFVKAEKLNDNTELLSSNKQDIAYNQTELLNNETEVLDDNATQLLNENAPKFMASTAPFCQANSNDFKIVQNIIIIHTNETI